MLYGMDAYIMNYIFNYQIKTFNKIQKVGFPNLEKVIKALNNLKINYLVVNETKKKLKNKQNKKIY